VRSTHDITPAVTHGKVVARPAIELGSCWWGDWHWRHVLGILDGLLSAAKEVPAATG